MNKIEMHEVLPHLYLAGVQQTAPKYLEEVCVM